MRWLCLWLKSLCSFSVFTLFTLTAGPYEQLFLSLFFLFLFFKQAVVYFLVWGEGQRQREIVMSISVAGMQSRLVFVIQCCQVARRSPGTWKREHLRPVLASRHCPSVMCRVPLKILLSWSCILLFKGTDIFK